MTQNLYLYKIQTKEFTSMMITRTSIVTILHPTKIFTVARVSLLVILQHLPMSEAHDYLEKVVLIQIIKIA